MTAGACFIGCAGWSLPRDVQHSFGPGGNHLARYATQLPAVEINSSFHRPHARKVYERWALSVPKRFRFCAKLPKAITHERRLQGCEGLLDDFLGQAGGLGEALDCLLVQLPPSLAFEPSTAGAFLRMLRDRFGRAIAVEPRHASWFGSQADALLRAHGMARVLADPVLHDAGRLPGGEPSLVYLRLHGSPRVYYSAYAPDLLARLAARIAVEVRAGHTVWCIFDNTAGGAAAGNALALAAALQRELP